MSSSKMTEDHSRGTCSTVSVQHSELPGADSAGRELSLGALSMAAQQPAQPQHEMCELALQSKSFSTGGSRM